MAEMLAAQHHVVIQTNRQTEAGDQTDTALVRAITALVHAWRGQEEQGQALTSPYSTRAAVRQMLDWQRPPSGARR
jgi:hypothetical protein